MLNGVITSIAEFVTGHSNTTSGAKPMGPCADCGFTVYEYLHHSCPTGIRPTARTYVGDCWYCRGPVYDGVRHECRGSVII